jgi:starch-binding outer membrane protein, SusD/RagB family
MKKITTYISFVFSLGVMSSCHDVVVPISTELTPDIFPQNTSQFIQASGPPYAALRGNYAIDY